MKKIEELNNAELLSIVRLFKKKVPIEDIVDRISTSKENIQQVILADAVANMSPEDIRLLELKKI